MANLAPLIDERTETDIAAQVQELLGVYAPKWRPDPQTGQPQGVSRALINVFARYASLVIQRLNGAPDKNLLAFLDLLGAALLPPEPARVPLTFLLAAGSATEAIVPLGTQAAATLADGEKEPVIFETERKLIVTAAQLTSLWIRDPQNDQYADQSVILVEPSTTGASAFSGSRSLDHILYIGSQLFSFAQIDNLDLTFDLVAGFAAEPDLIWEYWDGYQWQVKAPASDETQGFTQTGKHTVKFANFKSIPVSTVNSVSNCWLRCRLATHLALAGPAGHGDLLPEVKSVSVTVKASNSGLALTNAFANALLVDPSKDFFPFGEKPKFGDTLYLANAEAFSQAGAQITFNVALNNPDTAGTQDPATNAAANLELTWEFWNGVTWVPIGTSKKEGTGTPIGNTNFKDDTQAFTKHDATHAVSFTLPQQPAPTPINGVSNYWIRVRISGGDYGKEAHYDPDYDTGNPRRITGYHLVPATFAPPSISQIAIDYSVQKTGSPDLLTYNDFRYDVPGETIVPFQPTTDKHPSLYLGFAPPPSQTRFPNRPLSLYFSLTEVVFGQTADNPKAAAPPHLVWEYWNGSDWFKLTVNDETDALTHSGLIELLPPADFAPGAEFGLTRYWLRARWDSGDYQFMPRLGTVLLNTTTATQTLTLTNEILGSSVGSEGQTFRTTRAPVLKGQQLQVREPELPAANERLTLEKEEGQAAVMLTTEAAGRPREIWVRWHQVPDFYASGPRDRHYVLDHLTGEIRFGDGQNGLIPPIGTGNLRLARYQTGGGARGNRAARTVVQLKTTIPYIDKVINPIAASGGSDAEALESLIARAPRTIRHGGRAVTREDYEDLALLASPEVARARCVPLFDLAVDPDAQQKKTGAVSLIIVPRSASPKPLVSLELINRVRNYLAAYCVLTSDLIIVGPDYVRVDVDVEIVPTAIDVADEVEAAVTAALIRFLHPLTGGLDGAGWDFGRRPHKSDVYALLEAIPGVDHIATLRLDPTADRTGADKTDRFLVYAGAISPTLKFE